MIDEDSQEANQEALAYAKALLERSEQEQELFLAKFITENPDVPIEEIELVMSPDGETLDKVFSVRRKGRIIIT